MNIHLPHHSITGGQKRRIAVIGSGISGAAAAWFLRDNADIALYEANDIAGGHTATKTIDYDGKSIAVDVGFIVFNERNYPNLCALFDHLDVASETSDMSFSVSLDAGRLEWSGRSLSTVFAQKRNIASPGFLRMLADVVRFNRNAVADRDSGYVGSMTIAQYIAKRGLSRRFRDDYLIPMGAAIWSTPEMKMMDFPARAFINFFENHRLLEIAPPVWRTVSGGSRNYHDKLIAGLGNTVRLATPVTNVSRLVDGGAIVADATGNSDRFDAVIFASHSDQTLAMLEDACDDERAILGNVAYKPNRVVLHRDARFMPRRKKAWAAWNALRNSADPSGDISLTYWMNRLQNIDDRYPLFVTLNPSFEPDPSQVFGEWTFEHPQFDAAAFDAQQKLTTIQGKRDTWFAGAWTGYGFHEDGLKSAITVARQLGGHIPWMDDTTRHAEPVGLAPAPA